MFTDGWGRPILLDENQNEGGPTDCRPDELYSGGTAGISFGPTQITYDLPISNC